MQEIIKTNVDKYVSFLLELYPNYLFKASPFYAGMGHVGLSITVGSKNINEDKLCGIDAFKFNEIKQFMFKSAYEKNKDWFDYEILNGSYDNEFYMKAQSGQYIPVHIGARHPYSKMSMENMLLMLQNNEK